MAASEKPDTAPHYAGLQACCCPAAFAEPLPCPKWVLQIWRRGGALIGSLNAGQMAPDAERH